MHANDPTALAIDAEVREAAATPGRADVLARMLPQLLGAGEVSTSSGLPQSGAEGFADYAAVVSNAPLGLGPGYQRKNLGEMYANRAQMQQRAEIANAELANRRAQTVLELLAKQKPGERWEPITDAKGRVVGQRNVITGETKGAGLEAPAKPVAVAPGSVLIDPDTGAVMYQAPDRESLQPVEGMIFDRRSGQYKDAAGNVLSPEQVMAQVHSLAQARSVKVSPSTTVNLKEETEEAKAVGKAQGENYVAIQQAGQNAQSRLAQLDRFNELLQGVSTGRLTPVLTELQEWADAFGLSVDLKNLSQKQAIEALTNKLALQARDPSGGAGMPGALSDKDREFLVKMMPSLSKTPGGNRLLIETMKKLAQRDIEVAQLARDYRSRHGKINEGFYDELRRFSEANPLFGRPSLPSGWSVREVK
jgi:hypothetical protein